MNVGTEISYAEQIAAVDGSIETLKYTVAALDGSPEGLKMIDEMNRMIAVRETLKHLSKCRHEPGLRELPVLNHFDTQAEAEQVVEQAAIVMYVGLEHIAALPTAMCAAEKTKIAEKTLAHARRLAAGLIKRNVEAI